MTAAFSKLPRSSMSSDASHAIKELIMSGQLKPGDRLPPERELSEMLGISRPTVRESIHALVAMNILETRHGRGTYVGSLQAEELLQPLQFVFSVARGALQELFEARLILEPPMAELAAERASAAEIDEMRDCLSSSRECLHSRDEFAECDVKLHNLISSASRNRFLANQLRSIHTLGVESRALTVQLPKVAERTLHDHELIVDAIAAHKPAAARRAMKAHLDGVAAAAAAAASSPPRSRNGSQSRGSRTRPTPSRADHQ